MVGLISAGNTSALPQVGRSLIKETFLPHPMIYVARFCGVDDASTSAAIRQAMIVLDKQLESCGEAPEDLVLVYRNRLAGAVKLEIGYTVSSRVARRVSGEVEAGHTPAGLMASFPTTEGFNSVLDAEEHLRLASQQREAFFSWQMFDASRSRPWRFHLPARLMAPLDAPARSSTGGG
jgi:hypothetical protein